jgi:zinc transporter, ZIP family
MQQFGLILLVTWLAGLAAVLGGVVGWLEGSAETDIKRTITHGATAFGGGILVAAVAFALLPPGMEVLGFAGLGVLFCLGGILAAFVDAYVSKRAGPKAEFMALILEFVPEALALGSVFAHDRRVGLMLAAFVGAQNLPEGFNSFRESRRAGTTTRRALLMLLLASLLGPLAACIGYLVLQDQVKLTAGIMAFASGAIMYLIFQDIAPSSKMRRHWVPAVGAVFGFAAGMLGEMLIG